jgi:perosamine synthetase
MDLSLSNLKVKRYLKLKIPNISNQIKLYFKNDRKIKKNFLFDIKYGNHSIISKDVRFVSNVLKNDQLTQGQLIRETEAKIADYVGAKYAVAVSSATAGLHLSYLALSINEKRRIITSPITFLSTANAALYCNSFPLFSDIELETINLCPSKLETSLKKNSDIYCISPIHFSGLPANMREINFLAKKNNLKIVEDAAHALGAKYECGSMVGSCKYSDLCVFSFHPVKIIAGGEGGMITTNSEDLYYKLLKLRTHGVNQKPLEILNKKVGYTKNIKNYWYYEMTDLGYHYRQTDIHCALIYSQMDRIEKFLKKRKKIAAVYDANFSKKNEYFLPQKKFRDFSSNHLYTLNFDFKKNRIDRNYLMSELVNRNIYTQVHYIPVPLQYYYKKMGYKTDNLENALNHYQQCISLPIYYDLNSYQQKYIIEAVNEILKV